MKNRITLEGYVVKTWYFHGRRFLRLAHHRPVKHRQVVSDYVSVQLPDSAPVLHQGDQVQVVGVLRSEDRYETVGRIMTRHGYRVDLPPEIANLMIVRPEVFLVAHQVRLLSSPENRVAEKEAVAITA